MILIDLVSRFWEFCNTKSIRKVPIVVEVLITNCQASEYPKYGPQAAHATTKTAAAMNATGEPKR